MTPRLDSLTALRFFAALGVVLCHLRPDLPPALGAVTFYFQLGVDFFFVLSGFVLAWSWKPARTKLRFYWLRFARIWPLHLVTMLAAIVVFNVSTPATLVFSPVLLQSWYPHPAVYWGLNGVAWTLSVEAFFYATFPFLMPALNRARSGTLWGIAALSVALMWVVPALVTSTGWDPEFQVWAYSVLPLSRLPQFVLGICIAVLLTRRATITIPVWAPALAAVVIFAGAPAVQMPPWQASVLVTVLAAVTIIALAQAEPGWSRPVPGWLVALGEWSFALYLTHSLLLKVLHHVGLQGWVMVAVAVPASIALSAAAYLWWERPAEAWLRRRQVGERDRQTSLA